VIIGATSVAAKTPQAASDANRRPKFFVFHTCPFSSVKGSSAIVLTGFNGEESAVGMSILGCAVNCDEGNEGFMAFQLNGENENSEENLFNCVPVKFAGFVDQSADD
jgi:hypothetical protein